MLETSLWSSQDEDDNARREIAMDTNLITYYDADDFAPGALEILTAHALSFWSRMWYYLDNEEHTFDGGVVAQAGHDFWLTSQGHGAGFWGGDWPKYGDMLAKLAKCYPGEVNITVGEDGKLYI